MSTLHLPDTTAAWRGPQFNAVLKREIEASAELLPLQRALSAGSHALSDGVSAMVISASDTPAELRARVGIFFSSVIAGCNCADDPTPVEAQSEYCELELSIDKATALAMITLAGD